MRPNGIVNLAQKMFFILPFITLARAGPRSIVGSASDSRARGPGFDTRACAVLSFRLPLIQEGQLSVTGESMYIKYWLPA